MPACWTRCCRSSPARRFPTAPPTRSSSPAVADRQVSVYEHCAARARRQPHPRRARPAVDRHRRLERRHECGRRRKAAAKAAGSAGSCSPRSPRWRRRPNSAAMASVRNAGATTPTTCARRWNAPGTASGIAAATTTTARRSVRTKATNAGSTPSRSRGASSPAAADREHAAQAMAAVDRLLVDHRAPDRPPVRPAVRPRPAEPRLHQGLSARRARKRRPVHARRDLVDLRLGRTR